jgi:hypothetical protein
MDIGLILINLLEERHLVPELFEAKTKGGLAFQFILEGKLSSGQEAYG